MITKTESKARRGKSMDANAVMPETHMLDVKMIRKTMRGTTVVTAMLSKTMIAAQKAEVFPLLPAHATCLSTRTWLLASRSYQAGDSIDNSSQKLQWH